MTIWTLLIRGGNPFRLSLAGSPPLVHDGSFTLWNFMGKVDFRDAVVSFARGLIGSDGTIVLSENETGNDEMAAERASFRNTEGRSFQTALCPFCSFLDPLVPSWCGLEDWPPESVEAARALRTKADLDARQCPLRG